MFTGLIEEIGKVTKIVKGSTSFQFTIQAKTVLSDLKLGDSIATNGACLTVVHFSNDTFTVDIMSETVRLTTFNQLKIGELVNLERALRLSDRLDGHLVSGHIDGVGKIIERKQDDIATLLKIEAPKDLLGKMLSKGSIAIDGISLTLVDVTPNFFQVSIIPHTSNETTLLKKQIGQYVNLETDMIGKYVLRFLHHDTKETNKPGKTPSSLNMEFLAANGFL
ncbi:MAG: riboflavin synthase [Bacteroidales bacterium]|nr:riboflavin synthase [Bacteroidales bacterium]